MYEAVKLRTFREVSSLHAARHATYTAAGEDIARLEAQIMQAELVGRLEDTRSLRGSGTPSREC